MRTRHDELAGLVEVNKQFGVCGCFSKPFRANNMGAPVWDIYQMIKDIDSKRIGAASTSLMPRLKGATPGDCTRGLWSHFIASYM